MDVYPKSITDSGHLLQPFQVVVTCPLLKKLSLHKNDVVNYLSVSNLPFLGKVIEAARNNKIFLEKLCSLDSFQSGFRTGYGTDTAPMALLDNFCGHIDKAHVSLLLLLDLSFAFDPCSRALLLRCPHPID